MPVARRAKEDGGRRQVLGTGAEGEGRAKKGARKQRGGDCQVKRSVYDELINDASFNCTYFSGARKAAALAKKGGGSGRRKAMVEGSSKLWAKKRMVEGSRARAGEEKDG